MRNKFQQTRDTENLVNALLLAIGVACVVVGAVLTSTVPSTIFLSVGCSLVSSGIVSMLSSRYIRKYEESKRISEAVGFTSMELTRAEMNAEIDRKMADAKTQIDYIAFGLKSLRDGNTAGVKAFLNRGGTVRIITVDPDCVKLSERDLIEKRQTGETRNTIEQLIAWASQLNAECSGKIELRFSDFLPSEFYCRVDDTIFIGPYQYGKDSQQMITFEYRSGKAFWHYSNYFEDLWRDKEYCTAASC